MADLCQTRVWFVVTTRIEKHACACCEQTAYTRVNGVWFCASCLDEVMFQLAPQFHSRYRYVDSHGDEFKLDRHTKIRYPHATFYATAFLKQGIGRRYGLTLIHANACPANSRVKHVNQRHFHHACQRTGQHCQPGNCPRLKEARQ